ncbi:MAG TPA: hypothetical protein VEO54_16595 [Thermoanaerobaculia bacterium]|nr:hypothetical protein [Thermoanaerobaculia bacterium]
MSTEVNILFTGICLFLTDKNRVIIGVANEKASCLSKAKIPRHYAYLAYDPTQRSSGKTAWKSNGPHEAVLLSGLVEIRGKFDETELKYPGSNPKLPGVVVAKSIAPAYTPLPTVLEDNPVNINPAVVAARIDLPPGTFESPIVTNEFWHFFPQKPPRPIRDRIAQAVRLTFHVSDDTVQVTEHPFGGGGPTEVITLKKGNGKGILFVIGNSSEPDIVPKVVQTKPATGPDHDFELHWNLFHLNGDPDCPPISFNEGTPGNINPLTLGGGNCPPIQWL